MNCMHFRVRQLRDAVLVQLSFDNDYLRTPQVKENEGYQKILPAPLANLAVNTVAPPMFTHIL